MVVTPLLMLLVLEVLLLIRRLRLVVKVLVQRRPPMELMKLPGQWAVTHTHRRCSNRISPLASALT